jgi:transposase
MSICTGLSLSEDGNLAGRYGPPDLRERILVTVEAGESPEAVAARFGCASVYRWAAAAREEGRHAPKPMIGGPKPAIHDETEAVLRRLLEENNHLTLVECRDHLEIGRTLRLDWT